MHDANPLSNSYMVRTHFRIHAWCEAIFGFMHGAKPFSNSCMVRKWLRFMVRKKAIFEFMHGANQHVVDNMILG